jgi:hypothetical protein
VELAKHGYVICSSARELVLANRFTILLSIWFVSILCEFVEVVLERCKTRKSKVWERERRGSINFGKVDQLSVCHHAVIVVCIRV